MADEHMKRYITSHQEIRVKSTESYHCTLPTVIKNWTVPTAGKDGEKLKHSYVVGENVK
jgi:hypothetical protein